MNKMKYPMLFLNDLANIFFKDYNSLMSIGFLEDMLKVRIDTSTGFHWERLYKIDDDLEKELMYIFDEFEKEIVKYSLHIRKGGSNE